MFTKQAPSQLVQQQHHTHAQATKDNSCWIYHIAAAAAAAAAGAAAAATAAAAAATVPHEQQMRMNY